MGETPLHGPGIQVFYTKVLFMCVYLIVFREYWLCTRVCVCFLNILFYILTPSLFSPHVNLGKRIGAAWWESFLTLFWTRFFLLVHGAWGKGEGKPPLNSLFSFSRLAVSWLSGGGGGQRGWRSSEEGRSGEKLHVFPARSSSSWDVFPSEIPATRGDIKTCGLPNSWYLLCILVLGDIQLQELKRTF